MVAEISASACSLLSCFICIFLSSLLIAADLFFLIPTKLFFNNFGSIGLVGCMLFCWRLIELQHVHWVFQHDYKPCQIWNQFDGTVQSSAPWTFQSGPVWSSSVSPRDFPFRAFLVLCCIPLIWCAPLPCLFALESLYNVQQLYWTNEWQKRHHPTVWMQVLHCHKSYQQELLYLHQCSRYFPITFVKALHQHQINHLTSPWSFYCQHLQMHVQNNVLNLHQSTGISCQLQCTQTLHHFFDSWWIYLSMISHVWDICPVGWSVGYSVLVWQSKCWLDCSMSLFLQICLHLLLHPDPVLTQHLIFWFYLISSAIVTHCQVILSTLPSDLLHFQWYDQMISLMHITGILCEIYLHININ